VNVHDFTATTVDGSEKPLADYAGDVLLIVNVASKCGFTPQYEGLETLNQELGNKGLQIVGFPCNQFGDQEPGTDAEIQQFCSTEYQVTFPVFAKVDVNGSHAAPLYEYLRAAAPSTLTAESGGRLYDHLAKSYPQYLDGNAVTWNFTKFLVGRDGEVIRRYESTATPAEIGTDVQELLVA
jgi:glutathione peroxidase